MPEVNEHSTPIRYATLRDYLRVVRRYWIMIALLGLVGAGAGLAYAGGQASTYKTSAEVSFQDPAQALGVVGLAENSIQSPGQVASVAAELVTAPSVMSQVKAQLGSPESVDTLAGHISAQVNVPSDLLEVTATATDPGFASNLANTTARVLVAQDNAQVRAQFAQLASAVERRIARLTGGGRAVSPSTSSELTFYEDELARLQTLASFARTAQFARPAGVPSASASPSPARSGLLGLLFGLLLGIAVAFLRDSTDRRLHGGQDFQGSVRLPVLGHVRSHALGRVVPMNGASGGEAEGDLEAIRIIRRNLELLDPQRPPRSIVVTSAVAEEGKTTVAASLALAMAAAGRRTLLVEGDLRRPALAARFGVPQTPGLTDYLTGAAAPHDTLRTIRFAEPPTGNGASPTTNGHSTGAAVHRLVCIPSGSRTSRAAELLGSGRFRQFLEQVAETYDAVVLDSSPLLPVSDTLEMLPYVDAAVLCVRESRTTRDQALAARAALARFPTCRAGIVVTGVKPRGGDEVVYAHAHQYA